MVLEGDLTVCDRADNASLSRFLYLDPDDQLLPGLHLPDLDDRAHIAIGDNLPAVKQVLVVVPRETTEEPVREGRLEVMDRDSDDPALIVDGRLREPGGASAVTRDEECYRRPRQKGRS